MNKMDRMDLGFRPSDKLKGLNMFLPGKRLMSLVSIASRGVDSDGTNPESWWDYMLVYLVENAYQVRYIFIQTSGKIYSRFEYEYLSSEA